MLSRRTKSYKRPDCIKRNEMVVTALGPLNSRVRARTRRLYSSSRGSTRSPFASFLSRTLPLSHPMSGRRHGDCAEGASETTPLMDNEQGGRRDAGRGSARSKVSRPGRTTANPTCGRGVCVGGGSGGCLSQSVWASLAFQSPNHCADSIERPRCGHRRVRFPPQAGQHRLPLLGPLLQVGGMAIFDRLVV